MPGSRHGEGRPPVGCGEHGEAGMVEVVAGELHDLGLVVHHEDRLHGRASYPAIRCWSAFPRRPADHVALSTNPDRRAPGGAIRRARGPVPSVPVLVPGVVMPGARDPEHRPQEQHAEQDEEDREDGPHEEPGKAPAPAGTRVAHAWVAAADAPVPTLATPAETPTW